MLMMATCPQETIPVLMKELEDLGAQRIEPGYMAVYFEVDKALMYMLHLRLSTASQLFICIKEVSAKDPVMLLSQAKRVKFEDYLDPALTYRIDGVAGDRGEEAMTSNEISKQMRLGLEDRFKYLGLPIPKVDVKDPDLIFSVYLYKQKAKVSVITSGVALHKRGYRDSSHPAPLKETVAATILRIIGYDGTENFFDPFCGSGTIAIEAAFLATGKACNIHRKVAKNSFLKLVDFDSQLFRDVQDQERLKLHPPECQLFARDLEPLYVEDSRQNALRARVEKYIEFSEGSFFDLDAPAEKGWLVANLPYGERISTEEEMLAFYKKIGDTLKQKYSGWKAALLVPAESPWQHIGLKTSRRFNLLNGSIPTKLLVFELYSGTRKK